MRSAGSPRTTNSVTGNPHSTVMPRKPEPLTPEERQKILEQAPEIVKRGIERGWIKPAQKEKPAWWQKEEK